MTARVMSTLDAVGDPTDVQRSGKEKTKEPSEKDSLTHKPSLSTRDRDSAKRVQMNDRATRLIRP